MDFLMPYGSIDKLLWKGIRRKPYTRHCSYDIYRPDIRYRYFATHKHS